MSAADLGDEPQGPDPHGLSALVEIARTTHYVDLLSRQTLGHHSSHSDLPEEVRLGLTTLFDGAAEREVLAVGFLIESAYSRGWQAATAASG